MKKVLRKPISKKNDTSKKAMLSSHNECTVNQNNCVIGCSCGNPSGGACASGGVCA